MKEVAQTIPWNQLTIIGALAIIMLIIALAFVLKFKNNNRERCKDRCIDSDKATSALVNNEISAQNIIRMDGHLDKIKDASIKQTEILRQMLGVQKEQTIMLKKIAKNGKK